MPGTFQGSFLVTVYDTDYANQLKFSSLCNFLQECSRQHADKLGIGYSNHTKQPHAWVLNHLRMELVRQPVAGEILQIRTWSRGTKGLRAFRDFRIETSDGVRVGAASSEWILLNRDTMRPCKPAEAFPLLDREFGECPLSRPIEGIDLPQNLELFDQRQVRFNEIDLNGHVNNARYVTWIEDSIGSFLAEGKTINSIDIKFLHGAKLHEKIEVIGTHAPFCPKAIEISVSGISESDFVHVKHKQYLALKHVDSTTIGKTLVKACVEWSPRVAVSAATVAQTAV